MANKKKENNMHSVPLGGAQCSSCSISRVMTKLEEVQR